MLQISGNRLLMAVGASGRTSAFQTNHIKVGFEAFTAVSMKNVIFWDAMPCGSCENRRFGRTCLLNH
jgi:hypothetical protein